MSIVVQRSTSWNHQRCWIAPGGAAHRRSCSAFIKALRRATRVAVSARRADGAGDRRRHERRRRGSGRHQIARRHRRAVACRVASVTARVTNAARLGSTAGDGHTLSRGWICAAACLFCVVRGPTRGAAVRARWDPRPTASRRPAGRRAPPVRAASTQARARRRAVSRRDRAAGDPAPVGARRSRHHVRASARNR
jgi:hypothetical protein